MHLPVALPMPLPLSICVCICLVLVLVLGLALTSVLTLTVSWLGCWNPQPLEELVEFLRHIIVLQVRLLFLALSLLVLAHSIELVH